ncbi:DUF736 family protein [uncultured Roseobacter sp.]|uniref:DUF736 family protein n=1 Tax=uncultured Roseobacter sp. TaxID=114847 RepID=UPI00260A722F|nr:DUF736 family protein [uncultured Roseobacter sp.]
MTKSKKITLSASRDIPFNKLVLSQANVRKVKAGVSIEELAEDIARRMLLASLKLDDPSFTQPIYPNLFDVTIVESSGKTFSLTWSRARGKTGD